MTISPVILPADDVPPPRRVYVASPLSTYRTPRYETMLNHISARFPASNLLPARDLFASNAEWRHRWPGIRRILDGLVFFDDDDGCIGLGTYAEIADVAALGLPVWFLTDAGTVHRLEDASFALMGDPFAVSDTEVQLQPRFIPDGGGFRRDPTQWAIVARRVSLEEFLESLLPVESGMAGA